MHFKVYDGTLFFCVRGRRVCIFWRPRTPGPSFSGVFLRFSGVSDAGTPVNGNPGRRPHIALFWPAAAACRPVFASSGGVGFMVGGVGGVRVKHNTFFVQRNKPIACYILCYYYLGGWVNSLIALCLIRTTIDYYSPWQAFEWPPLDSWVYHDIVAGCKLDL